MPVTGLLTSEELQATIDTPALGPAESLLLESNAIPQREPSPFAPLAEGFMGALDTAGKAPFESAMFPGGPLSEYVVKPIAEPISKVFTGEPINVGEFGELMAGGAAAVGKVAKGGLSFLQKPLGISRNQKVADALGNEAYFGPGAEHTRKWLESEGFTPEQIVNRMDWYKGGMGNQLTMMGAEVFNTLGRTLFSPKNDKLLNKYGIAPHIADDYRRMFALEDEMGKGAPRLNQLKNEMLSQLKYNLDVMIRRDPDAVPEIADLFFTNRMPVKADDLRNSGLPIKKLFGDQLDMPIDAIRDHIGEFAARAGTFGDKTIQMSGTRFSQGPKQMMQHTAGMKNNPARMAYDVIRRMPEGIPRTLDNIIATARKEKFSDKRSVDISKLMEDSVDTGGYLSFGGRSLGIDRLYGNYNWRLIIDKKTGEGYMVMMDEMKLGVSSKRVNNALQYGGDESLGIDIIKLDNKLNAQGLNFSPAPDYKTTSPIIREYVEKAQADPPTATEQLQFMLKRAAQAIGTVEGGRLAGYVLHSDKPAPMVEFGPSP